jgi:hypothetical protein
MLGFDLWKLIGGGVAVSVLVGSCVARDWRIEQRGGQKVAQKIEKATNETIKKADSAGRKSADPNSGGVRNPYYRPD